MDNRRLTITPCRLIPCDIGTDLSDSQTAAIRTELEAADSWRFSDKLDSELARIEAEYNGSIYPERSADFSVHIFDDGVCVFCLEDYTEQYDDFRDYNPEETLNRRFEIHDMILSHDHPCSDALFQLLTTLRSLVDSNKKRFTATRDWESRGLSYVFSFYFLDVDVGYISEETLQDKLVFLLFSEEAQQGIERASEAHDDPEEVKRRYRNQFREILQEDHEALPHLHTCASWSTLLVIGDVSASIVNDYRSMEINLQRTWFYTYITGKFIQHSLSRVSEKTPKTELEQLYRVLTTMMNQIATYQSINESMLTTRELELYNMLRDTSQLDRQIKTVREQANLARQRYEWLLNEKRTRGNKRIDLALFIIAIVTLVSEYRALLALGVWLIPISLGVLLVSLYFFTSFFGRELQ